MQARHDPADQQWLQEPNHGTRNQSTIAMRTKLHRSYNGVNWMEKSVTCGSFAVVGVVVRSRPAVPSQTFACPMAISDDRVRRRLMAALQVAQRGSMYLPTKIDCLRLPPQQSCLNSSFVLRSACPSCFVLRSIDHLSGLPDARRNGSIAEAAHRLCLHVE